MVIDVHTHLNNYDEARVVPLPERLDQLQESIRFNKVDHVLVLGDFKPHFKRFMLQQVKDMIIYAGKPEYLLYGTD